MYIKAREGIPHKRRTQTTRKMTFLLRSIIVNKTRLLLLSSSRYVPSIDANLDNACKTLDSSVGRAEDCRLLVDILRSLVRIRLEGRFFKWSLLFPEISTNIISN